MDSGSSIYRRERRKTQKRKLIRSFPVPVKTEVSIPECWYLVHALRDELSLAVDAGEGAVPRHLLERVGDVSRRRRAAVRRVGA